MEFFRGRCPTFFCTTVFGSNTHTRCFGRSCTSLCILELSVKMSSQICICRFSKRMKSIRVQTVKPMLEKASKRKVHIVCTERTKVSGLVHPISLVSSSGWGGVDNQFIVQVSQSSTKVKSTESSSSSLARDDNSRFGRSSTDVEYASFSDDEEVQTDTEGSSKTDECASKWDDALDDDHVSIDDRRIVMEVAKMMRKLRMRTDLNGSNWRRACKCMGASKPQG